MIYLKDRRNKKKHFQLSNLVHRVAIFFLAKVLVYIWRNNRKSQRLEIHIMEWNAARTIFPVGLIENRSVCADSDLPA